MLKPKSNPDEMGQRETQTENRHAGIMFIKDRSVQNSKIKGNVTSTCLHTARSKPVPNRRGGLCSFNPLRCSGSTETCQRGRERTSLYVQTDSKTKPELCISNCRNDSQPTGLSTHKIIMAETHETAIITISISR